VTALPSEQWVENGSGVAEHDGVDAHAAITLDLDQASTVRFTWLDAHRSRVQGLCVAADDDLVCGEVISTRFSFWNDNAPPEFEIQAPAGPLTIWNVWADEGSVHAWVGAAGIRRESIDDSDHRWRLIASDGHDSFSEDLTVEVEVVPGQ